MPHAHVRPTGNSKVSSTGLLLSPLHMVVHALCGKRIRNGVADAGPGVCCRVVATLQEVLTSATDGSALRRVLYKANSLALAQFLITPSTLRSISQGERVRLMWSVPQLVGLRPKRPDPSNI